MSGQLTLFDAVNPIGIGAELHNTCGNCSRFVGACGVGVCCQDTPRRAQRDADDSACSRWHRRARVYVCDRCTTEEIDEGGLPDGWSEIEGGHHLCWMCDPHAEVDNV